VFHLPASPIENGMTLFHNQHNWRDD